MVNHQFRNNPQATAVRADEMPDIHITRVPTAAVSAEVVIQSNNTTIETPRIDLSSVSPDAKGGELIVYEDSYGAYSIAITGGDASRLTGARVGDEISIVPRRV